MKKLSIIIVVLAVVVVGVGAWLVAAGKLSIQLKDSQAVAVVSPRICSDSIIKQFNDVYAAKDETEFKNRLNATAGVVKKQENYKTDASCVYILAYHAIYNKDARTAQGYIDTLSDLAKDGQYASANIHDVQGLYVLGQQVKYIHNDHGTSVKKSESDGGQG